MSGWEPKPINNFALVLKEHLFYSDPKIMDLIIRWAIHLYWRANGVAHLVTKAENYGLDGKHPLARFRML